MADEGQIGHGEPQSGELPEPPVQPPGPHLQEPAADPRQHGPAAPYPGPPGPLYGPLHGPPAQPHGLPQPYGPPGQPHGPPGQPHPGSGQPYPPPGQAYPPPPPSAPPGQPYPQPMLYSPPQPYPYGSAGQPPGYSYGQPGTHPLQPGSAPLAGFPEQFPPRRAPRRSRGRLIAAIAAGCAGVAAVTGGIIYFTRSGTAHSSSGNPTAPPGQTAAASPGRSAASSSAPAVPSVSGRPKPYFFDNSLSTSIFGHNIMTRAKDPAALTLPEIFNQTSKYGQPVSASQKLTLLAKDLTSNCAVAAWGPRLQADLRAAGCTQVARGMYVNADRKYIGMLAVFNLRDNTVARSVAFAMGPATVKANAIVKLHNGKDGFVLPLAVRPASDLGNNRDNECLASADGHFLVIEWAQGPGKLSQPDDFALDGVQNAVDSVTWFITVRDDNAQTAP